MKKFGFAFEFEVPDNWLAFIQGARYVYQGTLNEELIISGFIVEFKEPGASFSQVREQLFKNAANSVINAATNPELVITSQLERDDSFTDPECWRLSSVTIDESVIFEEAIFLGKNAVLLTTFEAPNSTLSTSIYMRFLNSVKEVNP